MLEFGAGPVIAYVISASLYASEIVLSEYIETNRKLLQMWLDRDPNALNWSPFFEYVVQELEGKSKEEAAKREEELRQVIKAVTLVTSIKIPQLNQPTVARMMSYIFTSYCLESACNSLKELSEAMALGSTCTSKKHLGYVQALYPASPRKPLLMCGDMKAHDSCRAWL